VEKESGPYQQITRMNEERLLKHSAVQTIWEMSRRYTYLKIKAGRPLLFPIDGKYPRALNHVNDYGES
jgi:hypothetical protein